MTKCEACFGPDRMLKTFTMDIYGRESCSTNAFLSGTVTIATYCNDMFRRASCLREVGCSMSSASAIDALREPGV